MRDLENLLQALDKRVHMTIHGMTLKEWINYLWQLYGAPLFANNLI